eukprot:scaffold5276_cov134-Cylindrotheca_fusiformis.AAC.12
MCTQSALPQNCEYRRAYSSFNQYVNLLINKNGSKALTATQSAFRSSRHTMCVRAIMNYSLKFQSIYGEPADKQNGSKALTATQSAFRSSRQISHNVRAIMNCSLKFQSTCEPADKQTGLKPLPPPNPPSEVHRTYHNLVEAHSSFNQCEPARSPYRHPIRLQKFTAHITICNYELQYHLLLASGSIIGGAPYSVSLNVNPPEALTVTQSAFRIRGSIIGGAPTQCQLNPPEALSTVTQSAFRS